MTPSRSVLQAGKRDANSSFCDNSSNSHLLDQLKAQNQGKLSLNFPEIILEVFPDIVGLRNCSCVSTQSDDFNTVFLIMRKDITVLECILICTKKLGL